MQRRDFLKTTAATAAGLTLTPLLTRLRAADASANPQTKRPNILLIMADDLNHWVGYIGRNPQTRTPNLDRFAAQATAFDHAYTVVPLCNPARCALFSGLRASTTGVYTNENLPWRSYIDESKALNGYLKSNGYHTAGAGKVYHVGGRGSGPDSQGVQWDDYFLGGPSEEGGEKEDKSSKKKSGNQQTTFYGKIEVGSPDIPDNETSDNAIARWAASQLRKKHDKPFFIAAGFHKPHLPLIVPKKYFDMFPPDQIQLPPHLMTDLDDIPPAGKKMLETADGNRWPLIYKKGGDEGEKRWKSVIQAYLAAIAFADAQMGLILDALAASEYAANTIVVIMADHGYHLGEKQHIGKAVLWEEATRVPCLWRVPGLTPAAGAVSHRAVETFNLYPTLCDLVGLPVPAALQGVSIKPLLADPAAEWTRPAVSTYDCNNHTARTAEWRYIRYANNDEELYDLKSDPNEWRNIASDPEHTAVKQDLAKWLPAENVPNRAGENKAPPSAQEKRAAGRRNAGAKKDAAK